MPPFFFTQTKLCLNIWKTTASAQAGDGKNLVGALSVQKLLFFALLLRWYVEHRAVIKACHHKIDYQATKIFTYFVEQVTGSVHRGCGYGAKFCLLRCSNCWKTAIMENPLSYWRPKRAWSTQRMRGWWTERHQERTSAIWKNSSKRMSWEAGSRVSQSIERSRSKFLCIS